MIQRTKTYSFVNYILFYILLGIIIINSIINMTNMIIIDQTELS